MASNYNDSLDEFINAPVYILIYLLCVVFSLITPCWVINLTSTIQFRFEYFPVLAFQHSFLSCRVVRLLQRITSIDVLKAPIFILLSLLCMLWSFLVFLGQLCYSFGRLGKPLKFKYYIFTFKFGDLAGLFTLLGPVNSALLTFLSLQQLFLW